MEPSRAYILCNKENVCLKTQDNASVALFSFFGFFYIKERAQISRIDL